MLTRFIRYCLTILSFFFKNNLDKIQARHTIVSKNLKKKMEITKIKFSARLKTHKFFNNVVNNILIENKTINFLKNTHIQNIFFIHNRFFIRNELAELKMDKNNWALWKRLLIENNVGDPIKYFLYPKSSGNRIRQVYHLKKFLEYSNINLFNIKYVLEIGGGYGCMAQIFKMINKNCTYLIFDTIEVNFLQYYYLQMNKVPVVINQIKPGKVCLINKISLLDQFNKIYSNYNSSLLIANWSISEMPIKLRNNILSKTKNFRYSMIGFQEKFENINNLHYFLNYKKKIETRLLIKIEKLLHYKKSMFNQNNHYYFFTKLK
jgi:hypothetical protein